MHKTEARSLSPELASAVVVCASDTLAALGCDLCDAVRAGAMVPLTLDSGSFAAALHQPDLMIQVVASDDMPAALGQLARLRVSAPACAVLVAAVGLNGAQIDHLLSAGACDF